MELPDRLFEFSEKLGTNACLIYMYILFDCAKNNRNYTNLGNEDLAKMFHISVSTMRDPLNDLERYGFIERKRSCQKRKIFLKEKLIVFFSVTFNGFI